jgi:hypothetical protein
MSLYRLPSLVRTTVIPVLVLLMLQGAISLLDQSRAALGAPARETGATDTTVPTLFNYQGTLRDPEGNPLTGHYDMTFRIYNDIAAPTNAAIWAEQHASVTVRSGHFSVLLGNTTPIPPTSFNSPDRFIGVTVAPYDEMVPRQRFASVPYAMHADHANDASLLGGQGPGAYAVAGHTHTSLDSAGSGPKDALSVTNNGQVNMSSPGARLHIQGNDPDLVLNMNSSGSNRAEVQFLLDNQLKSSIYWSKTDGKTYIQNGGTAAVTVHGTRVGIGTNSPDATLHVNGDLRVSGNILNFSVVGPFSLSSENGNNPTPLDLGSDQDRVCFVSKAGFRDLDAGDEIGFCEVYRSGGRWRLKADTTPGQDNDAYCHATCLRW